jgi:hypothetical protein
MQKALDQMNLQIHHVISDVTGRTGLSILDAILAGERDPAVLAKWKDPRVKASDETIVQSLVGFIAAPTGFRVPFSLMPVGAIWRSFTARARWGREHA